MLDDRRPLADETSTGIASLGTGAHIGVVEGQKLTDIQRAGLRDFRKMRGYFGAIHVSQDGQSYQHFVDCHNLDKVKTAAKTGCELFSDGSPCVIAAVSGPDGMAFDSAAVRGLGLWALRDFARHQKRQVSSTYGADPVATSAQQEY
jgi:hypothetical protein